jgi:hypothetical protein
LILDQPQVIEKMERETGFERATSSLGKRISIVNTGVRRSWRSFLVREVFCFQRLVFRSHLIEVIKVTIAGTPFPERGGQSPCCRNCHPPVGKGPASFLWAPSFFANFQRFQQTGEAAFAPTANSTDRTDGFGHSSGTGEKQGRQQRNLTARAQKAGASLPPLGHMLVSVGVYGQIGRGARNPARSGGKQSKPKLPDTVPNRPH